MYVLQQQGALATGVIAMGEAWASRAFVIVR
jgi:hypothetical protein